MQTTARLLAFACLLPMLMPAGTRVTVCLHEGDLQVGGSWEDPCGGCAECCDLDSSGREAAPTSCCGADREQGTDPTASHGDDCRCCADVCTFAAPAYDIGHVDQRLSMITAAALHGADASPLWAQPVAADVPVLPPPNQAARAVNGSAATRPLRI